MHSLTESACQPEDIAKAVEFLRAGQLVAFPTETVYGLGADASSAEALRRLYQAKGRPTDHPVIVHLHHAEQVHDWAQDVPEVLDALSAKFWPGPLTVVLKRKPHVLNQVTGGQDTVAVRLPNHPVARQLLQAFDGGLAAPSANKFGRLSPTLAVDVRNEFKSEVAMVLDGGSCEVGIESTIIDLSGGTPKILRPGMITALDIESVLGVPLFAREAASRNVDETDEVRVPGSLPSHYAPETKLALCASGSMEPIVSAYLEQNKTVALFHHTPHTISGEKYGAKLHSSLAPSTAAAYAHVLYHALRELDAIGANLILVEEPPSGAEWAGVWDRLRRAAAENS